MLNADAARSLLDFLSASLAFNDALQNIGYLLMIVITEPFEVPSSTLQLVLNAAIQQQQQQLNH